MAPTAMAGTAGKRPSISSTKSAGPSQRTRMEASLMMSSKEYKSTDDVNAARRNKSSDRLHRLGGGASSTSLAQKRNKSHSQLMSAGAIHNVSSKQKKKETDADDDEGWTSSSQKGTPEHSPIEGSDSDNDDEGLVMRKREKRKAAFSGTTPTGRNPKASSAKQEAAPTTTAVPKTLRGFETRQPVEDTLSTANSNKVLDADSQEADAQSRFTIDVSAAQNKAESSPSPHLTPPTTSGSSRALHSPAVQTTGQESRQDTSSPTSIRSRASLRSRSSLLFPRESTGPAAPKLSTQYALAGALGSLQEDSEFDAAMIRGDRSRHISDVNFPTSKSEAGHLKDWSLDSSSSRNRIVSSSSRRKSSISSIHSGTIKLPTASPSMGDISMGAVRAEHSQHGSGSTALDAMQRASGSAFHTPHDRVRKTSTFSLNAADATNLATRLRMARGESFDEAHTTSASKLLASSNSKFFTISNRNDLASAKALKEYNKPIISVFVRRLGERKNIEVGVEAGSLFDEDFSRATLRSKRGSDTGKASDHDPDDDDDEEPMSVRYVMDFGLGGPAVHKTPTTEALLKTLLDHDEFEATWAPALANAAGLGEGTRRAREATREGVDPPPLNGLSSTGGVAINGPNAVPMHFLHGLTNTTDAPFPLDPSDMVTGMEELDMPSGGEYLDAKNLRSIAMTWTALNVNKSHIVTRRYVDPMRESIERIQRASGAIKASTGHSQSTYPGHSSTPGSGTTTPGGSLRWSGWRNLFSEQHKLPEEG